MVTKAITIKGKVQGVFFRASAKEAADKLGVTGSVRNLPDGNVFILATAEPLIMEKFISWCKSGPVRARVDQIEVREAPETSYKDFRIERD